MGQLAGIADDLDVLHVCGQLVESKKLSVEAAVDGLSTRLVLLQAVDFWILLLVIDGNEPRGNSRSVESIANPAMFGQLSGVARVADGA